MAPQARCAKYWINVAVKVATSIIVASR